MKWEYLTRRRELNESELNSLGKDGWELVGYSMSISVVANAVTYIFKREIPVKRSYTGPR